MSPPPTIEGFRPPCALRDFIRMYFGATVVLGNASSVGGEGNGRSEKDTDTGAAVASARGCVLCGSGGAAASSRPSPPLASSPSPHSPQPFLRVIAIASPPPQYALFAYVSEAAPPSPSMTGGGGRGLSTCAAGRGRGRANGLCERCSMSSPSFSKRAARCQEEGGDSSGGVFPMDGSAANITSAAPFPRATSILHGGWVPHERVLSRSLIAASPFLQEVMGALHPLDIEWFVTHGALVAQRGVGEGYQHVLGTSLAKGLQRERKVYRRPLRSFLQGAGGGGSGRGVGRQPLPRAATIGAVAVGHKRGREEPHNGGRTVPPGHDIATTTGGGGAPAVTPLEAQRSQCLERALRRPLPTMGLLQLGSAPTTMVPPIVRLPLHGQGQGLGGGAHCGGGAGAGGIGAAPKDGGEEVLGAGEEVLLRYRLHLLVNASPCLPTAATAATTVVAVGEGGHACGGKGSPHHHRGDECSGGGFLERKLKALRLKEEAAVRAARLGGNGGGAAVPLSCSCSGGSTAAVACQCCDFIIHPAAVWPEGRRLAMMATESKRGNGSSSSNIGGAEDGRSDTMAHDAPARQGVPPSSSNQDQHHAASSFDATMGHALRLLLAQLVVGVDRRRHLLRFTHAIEGLFFPSPPSSSSSSSLPPPPNVSHATVGMAVVVDYLMSMLGRVWYCPPPSPSSSPPSVGGREAVGTAHQPSVPAPPAAASAASILPPCSNGGTTPALSDGRRDGRGLLPTPSVPAVVCAADGSSGLLLQAGARAHSLFSAPMQQPHAAAELCRKSADASSSSFLLPIPSSDALLPLPPPHNSSPQHLISAAAAAAVAVAAAGGGGATSPSLSAQRPPSSPSRLYTCFWGGEHNVAAIRGVLLSWLEGGITSAASPNCLTAARIVEGISTSTIPWLQHTRTRQPTRRAQLQQCLLRELLTFVIRHIVPTVLLGPNTFYFTHTPRNRSQFVVMPMRVWRHLLQASLGTLYGLSSGGAVGARRKRPREEGIAADGAGGPRDVEDGDASPSTITPATTAAAVTRCVGLRRIKPLAIWRKAQRLAAVLHCTSFAPPPPHPLLHFRHPSSGSSSSSSGMRTCLYSRIRLLPDGAKLRPIATLKASTPSRLVYGTCMRSALHRQWRRREEEDEEEREKEEVPDGDRGGAPPPSSLSSAAAVGTSYSLLGAQQQQRTRPNAGILRQARLALSVGHQQRCEQLGLPPFISNRSHDEEYREWLGLHRMVLTSAAAAAAEDAKGVPTTVRRGADSAVGDAGGALPRHSLLADRYAFSSTYPLSQQDESVWAAAGRGTQRPPLSLPLLSEGPPNEPSTAAAAAAASTSTVIHDTLSSPSPSPSPYLYFVRGDAQKCYDSLPQRAVRQCIAETIPHAMYYTVPMTAVVREVRGRGGGSGGASAPSRGGKRCSSSSLVVPCAASHVTRDWSVLVPSDDYSTGTVRSIPKGWIVEEAGAPQHNLLPSGGGRGGVGRRVLNSYGYGYGGGNGWGYRSTRIIAADDITAIVPPEQRREALLGAISGGGGVDLGGCAAPSAALGPSSSPTALLRGSSLMAVASSAHTSPQYAYEVMGGAVLRRALEAHTQHHLIAIDDAGARGAATMGGGGGGGQWRRERLIPRRQPAEFSSSSTSTPSPLLVFQQSIGLAQGSSVSMPLCDALFLAVDQTLCELLSEHTEGYHCLLRRVDDVVIATTSRACAMAACARITQGWPSVGFYSAPEKVRCTAMPQMENVTGGGDTDGNGLPSAAAVPWCGLMVQSLCPPQHQSSRSHSHFLPPSPSLAAFPFVLAFSIDWERYFKAQPRPPSLAPPGSHDTILSALRTANILRMRAPFILFCQVLNSLQRRLQTCCELCLVWCDAMVTKMVGNRRSSRQHVRALLKPYQLVRHFMTSHICYRQQKRLRRVRARWGLDDAVVGSGDADAATGAMRRGAPSRRRAQRRGRRRQRNMPDSPEFTTTMPPASSPATASASLVSPQSATRLVTPSDVSWCMAVALRSTLRRRLCPAAGSDGDGSKIEGFDARFRRILLSIGDRKVREARLKLSRRLSYCLLSVGGVGGGAHAAFDDVVVGGGTCEQRRNQLLFGVHEEAFAAAEGALEKFFA